MSGPDQRWSSLFGIDLSALLVGLVADQVLGMLLTEPRLINALPFIAGQLALTWGAWRLRAMGAAPRRTTSQMLLTLAVAVSALVVPLFTVAMLLDVSGVSDPGSAVFGTAAEPVVLLATLALAAAYPLVLLAHLVRPRTDRWQDEAAGRSANRALAIATDVHLVLAGAWVAHMADRGARELVVAAVAALGLYAVIAVPRFAAAVTRYDRAALISSGAFVLTRALSTLIP